MELQAWRMLHVREQSAPALARQELTLTGHLCASLLSVVPAACQNAVGSENTVSDMLSTQIYLCFMLLKIKTFAIFSIGCCQLIYC